MRRVSMIHALAALVLLAAAGPALAMFAPPKAVPVHRLVRNITQYVQQHPDEAQGHYALGRAHYLAFAYKSPIVGVYPRNRQQTQPAQPAQQLPRLAPRHTEDWAVQQYKREHPNATQPSADDLRAHVEAARRHLQRAIQLAGDKPVYHLTYASLHEQAAPLAATILDNDTTRAEATRRWQKIALEHYRKAYDGAIHDELAKEHRPLEGLVGFVSYEAGNGYLRLARQSRLGDNRTIPRIRKGVRKLEAKTQHRITPIVFSLNGSAEHLSALLAPDTHVAFNLDGTGRSQRWPWVQPDTGILVWDPHRTGRITSGRQIFGSVTWWLFWRDGYRALAALDDDGDGELTGEELRGIAGWFDRNQNGVSDPGEVTPVCALGIEAIACDNVNRTGRHPTHPRGLRLETGETRPTWDWIAEPADP